nr:oligosaccharide flippase family protein [Vibrio parahaemolyticus]
MFYLWDDIYQPAQGTEVSLLKGSIYTLSGNVVYAFSQAIVVFIINKLGSPKDVGLFTFALATVTPLFILAQGGLRSRIVIDADFEYEFSSYFTLRLVLSALAVIIVLLIGGNNEEFIVVFLIACFKFFDSLFDILYGQYQRIMRFKSIAISKLIRSLLNISIFTLSYLYTNRLDVSLLFYVISSIISMFIYDFNTRFRVVDCFIKYRTLDLKKLLFASLPLAITAFLISMNTSISRIILENSEGLIALGAFGSFSYLIVSFQIIIQSVCQTFSPKMAKSCLTGDKENFIKLCCYLILFVIVISIVFVSFSEIFKEYIFFALFNEEFFDYVSLYDFIIKVSPLVFLSIAFGNICTASHNVKYQPHFFFIIMLVNILFCILYVDDFGIYIGGYSLALVSSLSIIFSFFYSFYGFRARFKI